MVQSVYASGFIDSSDSVTIRAEVSGYIEKIFVHEGEEVKKGQLLLIISNETIKENLREVEAQLASVKDRLMSDSDYRKELLHNIEIKKLFLKMLKKTLIEEKHYMKKN